MVKPASRALSQLVTVLCGTTRSSEDSMGPHLMRVTFYQINYPSSFVLDAPRVAGVVLHHIPIQTPLDHPFSTLWEELEVIFQ